MFQYALLLEYHGAGFVGWQWQDEGLSVQGILEAAAASLAFNEAPTAVAAGRTDAGVHAEAQAVMLELDREIPPNKLRDALNFHLRPHLVVVRAAMIAPDDWHPRFSAIGRAYCYRILNRPAPPALDAGRVWHVHQHLDAAAMHVAAQYLVGKHDFTSFRAAACQAKSPVKTLSRLDVTRTADEVTIRAEAPSFLHHQVRNLVGTLKLVGEGKWPAHRMADVLAARDRAAAGPTAPADGLTLVGVTYDPPMNWDPN